MRAYFEKLERCTYVHDPGQGKPNPTRHGYKGWLTTTGLDLTLGLGDPAVLQTVLKAIKAAWLEGFSGVLPESAAGSERLADTRSSRASPSRRWPRSKAAARARAS